MVVLASLYHVYEIKEGRRNGLVHSLPAAAQPEKLLCCTQNSPDAAKFASDEKKSSSVVTVSAFCEIKKKTIPLNRVLEFKAIQYISF